MDSIRQDLQYLTGPDTSGRLSGTAGALRAASYLAARLQELGVGPAGNDGYFQEVRVPAARLTGPVWLRINGIPYRYRRDFGEMAHLTAGGSLRSELAVVSDGDQVRPQDLAGKVILVPKRPENFDMGATAAAAAGVGAAGLLVEWGEPTWFHKTIFGSASRTIPVLRIRQSLANALASQSGAPVELDFPFEVSERPCRNVLGLLPGTDTSQTVAISAHYDHVGDDPGGERFPGAIDNASGVITMMEVVRTLITRQIQLPFNLLVAFLTGEESGVWGAKHLAAHPPVPLRAVINLDGMGYEESLQAIRLGYPGPGHWLADMAAEHYRQTGTEVRWTAGGDDSVAFQAAGLPALGLGQMATQPLPAQFHSPDDTSEVIHLPVIQQGAGSVISLLERLASQTFKGGSLA